MIYLRDRDGRTYAQRTELSFTAVAESYDNDGSSFTLPAGAAVPTDAGAWLVRQGELYLIKEVTPGDDSCRVACLPPEEVFDRKLVYTPGEYASIEAFITGVINSEFRDQADPEYAQPAMEAYADTSTAFVPPVESDEEESASDAVRTYNLMEYIRTVRDSFDVFCSFELTRTGVAVNVGQRTFGTHNIPFGDGHSVLTRRSYGETDSVAKVTTIRAGTTRDWYLAADGSVSDTVPAERARGRWELRVVGDDDDEEQAATKAFGSKAGGHRVEFDSDRVLHLGDELRFRLDGQLVRGRLSYAARTDGSGIWHYKSGELVTGLFAKLKGGKA